MSITQQLMKIRSQAPKDNATKELLQDFQNTYAQMEQGGFTHKDSYDLAFIGDSSAQNQDPRHVSHSDNLRFSN